MSFHKIDKWGAIAIVVANMVGTGVFTSLGFQLLDIQNAWSIMLLWIVGGLVALSGALTYAEIGTAMISNGGEYNYLQQLYHPSLGFVAGFISIVVGFAAPIAAACVAFGKYFSMAFFKSSYHSNIISLCVLFFVSSIHLAGIRLGNIFQKNITLLKILIMLIFLMAFFIPNANPDIFHWHTQQIFSEVFSSAFAVSLIYVSYAYSGWNASAYIAAEIDKPQRNLVFSLIAGTLVVTIFYVFLNMAFLYATPVEKLKGNVEVGIISAQFIFGKNIGNVIGLLISLLLISTISSMMIASPRVLSAMGEHYKLLSVFSKTNQFRSPYIAILLIALISSIMIITSTFDWLINFIGITLILFTSLTALGIFILRQRKNYQPVFKVPLYPITPLFFILMNLWILIYVSIQNISALIISFAIILCGFIIYSIIHRFQKV
ncbi:MAG: amino acid permease [Bacteroidota bacterium]